MALTLEQAAGVRELVDAYGQTLTYSGTSYPCFVGGLESGKELDAGGFALDYDISFLIAAADFSTAPTLQSTVTQGGKTYRILRITSPPDNAWYNLHCEETTRGA